MNHGLWGCILRLHHIHLVIYCPLQSVVYTSSIRNARHLLRSSIHMVPILCYCVFQDRTTMSLCFITHKVLNFYLCPVVQDQVMMHQHILFLQSLLVPSVIVVKEDDVGVNQINLLSSKAITVLSLLQQEAYKHRSIMQLLNPTSSVLLEPHQSACCSQDKLQKGEIVLALKVLFPSSSMASSLYLLSYRSATLHRVSILLMLSLLASILLPTTKQEVGQVSSRQFLQIGKHCVQNGIFYIFISILRLVYFHRILHYLWTIGNYNPSSIFITTRIITMIRGVLYSENIVLCSRVLPCCTFSLTSCMSFSRSSQI